MKLNGWQRMGVVLSVLWILPWGIFPWVQLWNYPNPSMDLGIHGSPFFDWVEDKSEMETGSRRLPEDPFELLVDGLIPLNPKLKIGSYLLITFGPVIFLWAVSYVLVFTLRWIAHGFKQST